MLFAPSHRPASTSSVRSDWSGTIFYIGAVLVMLVISCVALSHPNDLPVVGFTGQSL